jgi:cytochrome c-type biogenesis protein CcmH
MKLKHRFFLSLLILVAVFSLRQSTRPVAAQGGDELPPGVTDDEVYEVASEMYCDVCQGVPLSDCPSPQCQAWREEIADYIYQGYTKEEIKGKFADRYGEKISGTPIDPGNRDFVYAVPIFIAAMLSLVVIWQFITWSSRKPNRALAVASSAGTLREFDRPVPDNLDPVYLARFLELLNKDKKS